MKEMNTPVAGRQPSQRRQDDDKVYAAIEAHGSLSRAQIAEHTSMDDEAVRRAIDRLRDAGIVRKPRERQNLGKGQRRASVYTLGLDEEEPISRIQAQIIIHRHPQDVAFFGEYRRAA